MKGILLCGGNGKRLLPLTKVTNKHLLPVYDKPMVYYPIKTLVSAGITDIMILTGSEYAGDFINLLGNGKEFGANFTYKTQSGAGGIAEALGLCRDFVRDEPMVVILGDNIFENNVTEAVQEYEKDHDGAMVFLKVVEDPTRFGIALVEGDSILNIEEKPKQPKSNFAVTGLYFYNNKVWNIIDSLKPSARGELEISDVNNWYIKNSELKYKLLDGYWSDAGTVESLDRATRHMSNYETKVENMGKDELYCDFLKCLSCGNDEIPIGSNFCSMCGRKIKH
jgi:glucose-1-phosphate thymidylyltransferase